MNNLQITQRECDTLLTCHVVLTQSGEHGAQSYAATRYTFNNRNIQINWIANNTENMKKELENLHEFNFKKIFPFKYFPDYKYHILVDSNVKILNLNYLKYISLSLNTLLHFKSDFNMFFFTKL